MSYITSKYTTYVISYVKAALFFINSMNVTFITTVINLRLYREPHWSVRSNRLIEKNVLMINTHVGFGASHSI